MNSETFCMHVHAYTITHTVYHEGVHVVNNCTIIIPEFHNNLIS